MEALSPVKQALLEIRDLRARLAQVEEERHEPIAIVGLGLRAPGGAGTPEVLWAQLRDGFDAITETPVERWDNGVLYDADPDAPGKVSTRFGGFLRDVEQFDAPFFGVSRREAESIDPQHRLLLEVTWEALERAGIAPDQLAGTDAGFFVGIANSDYWRALYAEPSAIDVYAGMGGALSVAAGRLAYFLGAHGPTMCVDTACSSSLVSIHLACQSLRRGETSLALAGGVSLVLSPAGTINFSKARMLAPDGRCKTFDASADGYVRSDGCAMVVLKRLSTARADGDRVLAVIRGSAVNQDGRSNGLTAPNGAAQEAVIRLALRDAGVTPHDVHYVESHGTGTPLGDPIELRAMGAAYGAGRAADAPVVVGSVKTNVGHLEAAAGVMGLAKVLLSLQHEFIPPHLHVAAPTPLVAWNDLRLRLPAAGGEAWPRGAARRLAGLSSFGFSGTNAHLIIEEGDAGAVPDTRPAPPIHLVPLSARTPDALRAVSAAYADALGRRDVTLVDLAHTAAVGRASLRWARHVVVAHDADEAQAALQHVASGRAPVAQPGTEARPRVAFLFTGQGAQFPGMGRHLYDTAPVFRAMIDRCAEAVAGEPGPSLHDMLWGEQSEALLADTRYGQPATIALELAMAALWRSWGVIPTVVAGHSLGEFAAAAFSGAISVEDAMRLVIGRARLVDALSGDSGAMTVVSASRATVEAIVGTFASGAVELAADNGPAQVVLTGPLAMLAPVEARLGAAGLEYRRLKGVRHAFHSAQIEGILPAFAALARSVETHKPQLAWVSGLTGTLIPASEALSTDYWASQTRGTVCFHEVATELLRLGITAFVEVGPHPVLSAQISDVVTTRTIEPLPVFLPSMRRGADEWLTLADSMAHLFAAGGDIDWHAFCAPYAGHRVVLPTYAFERKRYWLPEGVASVAAATPVTQQRWAVAVREATVQAGQSPIGVDVTAYASHWALLERLSSALIIDTLRGGGLFVAAGEARSLEEAAAAASIVPTQHRLLGRWLQRLVRSGLLRVDGDRFVADAALPAADVQSLLTRVAQEMAGDAPLLRYVQNCARLLRDVMQGRASALDTLFPDGSFDLAEGLYTAAGTARYINALAAAAVAPLGDHAPQHRPARILEVGGGTGGTTHALVERLAGSGIEYWFTDVSDAFLERARTLFDGRVALRTAVFDADLPGPQQGLSHSGFDVIVAANALHATRNLTTAISNLCNLLAPGGFLVLVETTTHHAWFDVSTGLIEGWQHFEDDLRHDVPLLGVAEWKRALADGGFDQVVSLPGEDSSAAAMGQRVILARAPERSAMASGTSAPFDSAPIRGEGVPGQPATPAPSDPAVAWVSLTPGDRLQQLEDLVSAAVGTLLRRGDDPVAPAARLMEEGIDSLMAVQLRGTLSRQLGIDPPLPATLIFEHPTIQAIAAHLRDRLFPADADARSARNEPAPTHALVDAESVATLSDDDIAALLEQRYGNAGAGDNA